MLDVTNRLRSVKGGGATGGMKESVHFAALRRLCKNDIYVRFRNASPSKLHLSVCVAMVLKLTVSRSVEKDFQDRSYLTIFGSDIQI